MCIYIWDCRNPWASKSYQYTKYDSGKADGFEHCPRGFSVTQQHFKARWKVSIQQKGGWSQQCDKSTSQWILPELNGIEV